MLTFVSYVFVSWVVRVLKGLLTTQPNPYPLPVLYPYARKGLNAGIVKITIVNSSLMTVSSFDKIYQQQLVHSFPTLHSVNVN